MKINVDRDLLLESLSMVSGVVGKKQTLPILSNILFSISDNWLHLTSTDMEIELKAKVQLMESSQDAFKTTVPGRTLFDIVKSLPEESHVLLEFSDKKVQLSCERNRFSLATISAETFPVLDETEIKNEVAIPQNELKSMLAKATYAMAEQDVRYYLNGMLFELKPGLLSLVASDGHRLARTEVNIPGGNSAEGVSFIMPRKGVLELYRLLDDVDIPVVFKLSEGVILCQTEDFSLTSKMIEGNAPNYSKFFVKPEGVELTLDVAEFKRCLTRAAIVSNDAFKSVKLHFQTEQLSIRTHNTDAEQADVSISTSYQGDDIEIGFNVAYLLDVLSTIQGDSVKLSLVNASSSMFIEEPVVEDALHVVMPIRL